MRRFLSGLMVAAFVAVSVLATTQAVHAWGESEYTGNGKPQFNTYTNVPNVGDEHDFFKVGPKGANASEFSNEFTACEGEAQFTTYVHNGAPEVYNGTNNDGTGVAKDTKLAIKLQTNGKEESKAVISSSNAATVSDSAAVKCNGQDVKIEYVEDSAQIFSLARGKKLPLNNAVVRGGTLIGTYANDGVVAGCWDQRVYVTIVVKITKVVPPTPPVTPVTPVTPVVTPKELPHTGPSDVAGIVAAVVVAGVVGRTLVLSRRKG